MLKKIIANEVKIKAKEKYGKDFEVILRTKKSDNNVKASCLIMGYKQDSCRPVIYLRPFIGELKNGLSTMDKVVEKILEAYEGAQKVPNYNLNREEVAELIREKPYIQLVSAKNEKDFQRRGIVYEKYLDLLMCYRVVFNNFELGTATLLLDYENMSMAGVDKEYIHEKAKINTADDKWEVKSLSSFLAEKGFIGIEDDNMFIIGQDAIYGSSCLYTLNGIREFAEEKKKDVLILPSSVHELIILPFDDTLINDIDKFKAMVNAVNQEEVHEEDFLSNSVYLYERATEKVRIL